MESLIVGMDFSDSTITGARWVADQFAPGAELTLVHVVDPPDRPSFIERLLPPAGEIESPAVADAATRMRDLIAGAFPSARSEIRVGKPHEQILEVARERHADVVVVGPHGDRPRPHSWLGSTAERVVRGSRPPVLVTINPRISRPRTILVPIDERRLTESILLWAGHFAETFDADVKLLHVWSEAIYNHVRSMSRVGTRDAAAAQREIEKEVHDAATHWLGDLSATGFRGDRATAMVSHGNPGDVTLEMAAACDADLIVMGRSGGGAIAPALLGSTLRTVLHHATGPVFVITEPITGA